VRLPSVMKTRALFISFVLATLATVGAARADDSIPPPGYHVEHRASTGGMVGGGVLFSVGYVPSVALGSVIVANSAPAGALLYVPVAGPLVALGWIGGGGVLSGMLGAVLVGDSLLQAAGAAWFLVSALVKHDHVVRDAKSFRVAPAPLVAQGTVGLGVVGSF
jgi:hypothetical protein